MTWSVVAIDLDTHESAIAVASCVHLEVVLAVPGFSGSGAAIATQSYLLDGQRERGIELLDAGASPAEVLEALLDPAFDPAFELRQIAIADAAGRIAAFTGPGALSHASHQIGSVGRVSFSVQGNVLTGPEVVDAAARAMVAPGPCDLAERVLAALEAGGSDGRGDARCAPLGRAAQAATLRVRAGPEKDSVALSIDVGADTPGQGDDPLALLRVRFDVERAARPCPAAEGASSEGTGSGAGGEAPSAATSDTATAASEGDCAMSPGGVCEPAAISGAFALLLLVASLASVRRRRRRWARRRSRR